ncbi:hypothetical protein pEaSNUABM6_00026 [Erwinia phage pEa_SNUABM_6]|nr:hypothetical protein pEaSNUABM6_00026 [Erwinia phage pEa_SNUABM_6]
MVKLYIKPADVHVSFWGKVDKTPYAQALKMTEMQRQEVTVQLLHTALEHIFLSIEEMPFGQLHDHLENYVDQVRLHQLLHHDKRMEEPEVVRGKTRIVAETVFGNDILDTRLVDRIVYATIRELVDVAFGEIFNKFVDGIEAMIEESCKVLKRKFNRYSIVTITPRLGVRAKLVCLELELGEDIRHVYFNQCFPTGRYRSSNDDKIRDLQSLLPDFS